MPRGRPRKDAVVQASASNPRLSSVSRQEIGQSGTIIVSGIINGEEYNADLTRTKAYNTYDEMRRSDGTVHAALQACKLPILSTNWTIEAASEDPIDVEIADFVRYNLMEVLSFQTFLRQALTLLDFGFVVFELVYNLVEFDGNTYIGLSKIAGRKQSTVYSWQMSDGEPGITQFTVAKGYVSIPQEKLLVITNDQEGDNYEGISVLRAAYKHWYMKDALYKISAISHERQGLGIPYFKKPASPAQDEVAKAKIIAQNMRANEAGYLEIPEGWEWGFMDMKANNVANPEVMIMHHDRQIMKNVLAQFLELGASSHSGGGGRALSEDHSKLFEKSLEAVAKNIAEAINKQVIQRIVDANFSVQAYPKIKFQSINDENPAIFSTAINQLMTVNALTPDPDLEQYIREIYKLPNLPDEIRDNYYTRTTAALPNDPSIDDPNNDGSNSDEDPTEDEQDDKEAQRQMEQVSASETLEAAKKFKAAIDKNWNLLHDKNG